MPEIHIRDTATGDFLQIVALNAAAVQHTSAMDVPRLQNLDALATYHKVILVDGAVAGFLLAMRDNTPYPNDNYAYFAARYGTFLYIDRIVIDPSVVRGLGYYTGPVYEAELTFEILDEKGRKRQFGSVAGGGRYDDLVKRFTGQSVPATGVSIGVDRLLAALRAKGRAGGETAGPVVVTVMDRDRMADYMAMAAELRRAGIRAEVYLGNPKNFGNQLKYADKRASPVAVIQGSSEAEKGTVILKDLVLGARIAAGASLEEWKQRPAQREIPRAELVAAVRQMLD